MSNSLRTLHEIRAAGVSSATRKGAREIIARENENGEIRAQLRMPSTRREAVERVWGAVDKLTGEQRRFAEAICVEHKPEDIARFSEHYVAARSLPCTEVLQTYNRAYAKELEKDIAALEAYLAAIPVPLEELRRRHYLAREAQNQPGDVGGVHSAFSGLLD